MPREWPYMNVVVSPYLFLISGYWIWSAWFHVQGSSTGGVRIQLAITAKKAYKPAWNGQGHNRVTVTYECSLTLLEGDFRLKCLSLRYSNSSEENKVYLIICEISSVFYCVIDLRQSPVYCSISQLTFFLLREHLCFNNKSFQIRPQIHPITENANVKQDF